jgi:hypothetical protein
MMKIRKLQKHLARIGALACFSAILAQPSASLAEGKIEYFYCHAEEAGGLYVSEGFGKRRFTNPVHTPDIEIEYRNFLKKNFAGSFAARSPKCVGPYSSRKTAEAARDRQMDRHIRAGGGSRWTHWYPGHPGEPNMY